MSPSLLALAQQIYAQMGDYVRRTVTLSNGAGLSYSAQGLQWGYQLLDFNSGGEGARLAAGSLSFDDYMHELENLASALTSQLDLIPGYDSEGIKSQLASWWSQTAYSAGLAYEADKAKQAAAAAVDAVKPVTDLGFGALGMVAAVVVGLVVLTYRR